MRAIGAGIDVQAIRDEIDLDRNQLSFQFEDLNGSLS
jgi:hypothetical protein